MKWIGLTGGIASGKSTVSKILSEAGYPVIDADELARSMVDIGSLGLHQVVSHFGEDVLTVEKNLDRKKLGRLVFGQPDKLIELENILHPLIQKETLRRRRELEKQGEKLAFYDVPLLFEKKLENNFDAIIVVTANENLLRERMRQRDQLSDEEIESRLRSQIPLAEKISKATWVLPNEGTIDELRAAILELLKKI